ncbi:MAG: tubulin-like doman-containing protein [Alphaproteobacteria bacterium]
MAQMTLVLGFGGTGAHVLTYLKELAVYKHGRKPDNIAFLEFDTIEDWQPGKTVHMADGAGAETIASGTETGTSLDRMQEYLFLKDGYQPTLRELVQKILPSPVASEQHPQLRTWLHANWLTKLMPPAALNITLGAAQQRQVGRYAMFANATTIETRLHEMMSSMSRDDASAVTVWLVSSAAGGTGAGCMLDAGYLVYKVAADMRLRTTIIGAVVLPNVYSNTYNVTNSRSYSLFREIERMQEIGIPPDDRYTPSGINEPISQEVSYDAAGRIRSRINTRMFDYLVYLGRKCTDEKARTAFFRSVANAIDPYIDAQVSTKMMEDLVNKNGEPFSFGAARLNIPVTTFADLYAWELAEEYLSGLCAPRDKDRQVIGVHAGSEIDRADTARRRVSAMLKLFEDLQKLGEDREKLPQKLRNELSAREIVSRWYMFEAVDVAGYKLTSTEHEVELPLAFANPFMALDRDPNDTVPAERILVKTFKENRNAKGVKESQERSRDRFGDELSEILQRYLNEEGGEASFERGRQMVKKTVSAKLAQAVDTMVATELSREENRFVDSGRPDQGTALTRMYMELEILASREGPLGTIENTVKECIRLLNDEIANVKQRATDARGALKDTQSKWLGTWVEDPQENARRVCYEYVGWHQKTLLLEDMARIIADVRQRFDLWYKETNAALTSLALKREGKVPSLEAARRDHIQRLRDRLARMRRGTSTFITLAPDSVADFDERGVVAMQGFEGELRNRAVSDQGQSLAQRELAVTTWLADVDENGRPRLRLKRGETLHAVGLLSRLHDTLHQRFFPVVTAQLAEIDIFDYIQYLRNHKGLVIKDLVARLDAAATVLLSGQGTANCRWVLKGPSGTDKQDALSAIDLELSRLSGHKSPITIHSDPTSLTLIRGYDAGTEVADVLACGDEYVRVMDPGNGAYTEERKRALTYHPFRAEAEAWFIQHRHLARIGQQLTNPRHLMAPRIVRLLDRPEMMLAFVHCVATGAVRWNTAERLWEWVSGNAVLTLTQPGGDLMRAAITFVLQGREEKPASNRQIQLPQAMDSARAAAKEPKDKDKAKARAKAAKDEAKNGDKDKGGDYYQIITDFVQTDPLNAFLEEAFPAPPDAGSDRLRQHGRDREGLFMVFQFYGNVDGKSVITGNLADRILN